MKQEKEIYSHILRNRPLFMSGLIQDARKVLNTPMPTGLDIQWRMADFVVLGTWIARAVGVEEEFNGALAALKNSQRGFTLELDQAIILALDTYQQLCRTKHEWKSASQLWEEFMLYCPEDIISMLKNKYKTAPVMARKMTALLGLIRRIIPLETRKNDETGFSQWRLKPEEESSGA